MISKSLDIPPSINFSILATHIIECVFFRFVFPIHGFYGAIYLTLNNFQHLFFATNPCYIVLFINEEYLKTCF